MISEGLMFVLYIVCFRMCSNGPALATGFDIWPTVQPWKLASAHAHANVYTNQYTWITSQQQQLPLVRKLSSALKPHQYTGVLFVIPRCANQNSYYFCILDANFHLFYLHFVLYYTVLQYYTGCECSAGSIDEDYARESTQGACIEPCNMLYYAMGVLFVNVLLGSCSKNPLLIVNMRYVCFQIVL